VRVLANAAYLHIPFCEHICYYCDFNKYFMAGQPVDEYLKVMGTEMKESLRRFPSDGIETIYIGGGTPTALDDRQLSLLFENVGRHLQPRAEQVEYTVEANPENLTRSKLAIMKAAGVNRLSLGVQSFDNGLLAAVGRPHSDHDIEEALLNIEVAGFDNVSIDLMFKLPGQTLDQLTATLERALSFPIKHISIYSLQVEPRTIFYNRKRKGRLPLPGEDQEADMYGKIIDLLESRGFGQYEISNFARPGYESRHNRKYWENEDYYGFGAGAHSYLDGMRRVNAGWTKKYIRLVEEGGHAFVEEHHVPRRERIGDHLFLGLRMADGISKTAFQRKFGVAIESLFGESIERLREKRLLAEKNDRIFLTRKGVFLGNEVFEAFI
jgi:oxygen-independent coproporphyrinogen-3 oxidase